MQKIKAKKSLGQNFLQDENVANAICGFFDIEGKHVLEVGPGLGALTQKLVLKKPLSLHLVEFDRDMIGVLQGKVESREWKIEGIDFQIFQQDILTFIPVFGGKKDPASSAGGQAYYVIANIPYYITSPILFHFLYDLPHPPQKMLIMMQKEVGERILEGGKKIKGKNSLLSLAMWKKCDVEKVCLVPKTAFYPVPKVDSIVLAFSREEKYEEVDDQIFLDFLKVVFREPRKTLQNNLLKGEYSKESILNAFTENKLAEKVRAEELTGEMMVSLIKSLELSQK